MSNSTESSLQATPLKDQHISLGARMVPFSGWNMPVSFAGINVEHHCVRNAVGVFDASHMGLLKIEGVGAFDFVQKVSVNDAAKLELGMSHYSALCNEQGTCIDDIYVVCIGHDEYYFVLNAGSKVKDFAWLQLQAKDGFEHLILTMQDTGILSVQGPLAVNVMHKIWNDFSTDIPKNGAFFVEYKEQSLLVTRTGYTGEDGFEIFPFNSVLCDLYDLLLQEGKEWGIQPCGLGCRDTLRLESGFSLYGHELTESIDLISAGLSWIVGFEKDSFIGKEALCKIKAEGSKRKLVGLVAIDKALPRDGMLIENENGPIGIITSGSQSPTLNVGIALAYIDKEYAQIGNEVNVRVRDQLKKFRVHTRRFVGGKRS